MSRFCLSIVAVMLCCLPVLAETFQGRSVTVVDGRPDRQEQVPLVVVMHGFLANAKYMQRKTSFDRLAQQDGFVVAYPNGVKRRWNDGRPSRQKTDDVAYLSALITTLISDTRVDPKRVFLAGHSNGGGMAMRMACERPDLVRGIAVVATKSPRAYQCATGRPVPAIFFYGSADPIAPPEGRPDSSRLGGALSERATIELWQKKNRCSGTSKTRTIDRKDDGTSAKLFQFSRCAAPLVYVQIEGHGHDWPRPGNRATRLQGPATKEVDATALSWSFFESLN